MTKEKLKSGAILQIPLPKNLGFAYAKYIDLIELNPNNNYPDLVRIYDFRSKDSNIDINNLNDKHLLFAPHLVGGLRPTIRKKLWKIIGQLSVNKEDTVIPHYKYSSTSTSTINELEKGEWCYIEDADISKKNHAPYNKIQHLETIGAIGAELLGIKIAMGLLKSEGKKIEDYFELNEYVEREFYAQVMKIPFYFEQPKNIRGKVILG